MVREFVNNIYYFNDYYPAANTLKHYTLSVRQINTYIIMEKKYIYILNPVGDGLVIIIIRMLQASSDVCG